MSNQTNKSKKRKYIEKHQANSTKRKSNKPDINLVVTNDDFTLNEEGEKSCQLLSFLYSKLDQLPRSKVKSHLEHREVYVNGKAITKFNYNLKLGQEVVISQNLREYQAASTHLKILYEDDDIIVINKPAGLLSISTKKEKETTAYHFLNEYVKQKNKNDRIYVVHRLDRETSGVLMVAKNEKIKTLFQDNWNDLVKYRGYQAIVEGKVEKPKGQIKSWLCETKTHMMFSSETEGDGQLAITNYEVINSGSVYSKLSIWLETGRKNQIRVHMKDMGHPIAGDKMYGATSNPSRRLLLHAHKLVIVNPITQEEMTFETPFEKTPKLN